MWAVAAIRPGNSLCDAQLACDCVGFHGEGTTVFWFDYICADGLACDPIDCTDSEDINSCYGECAVPTYPHVCGIEFAFSTDEW